MRASIVRPVSLLSELPPDEVRGLLVTEYDALVEAGLLDDEPVELLEGMLVRMSPQSAPHAEAGRRSARQLAAQLPPGWVLSVQSPLALGPRSEPEPDLAIVPDLDYSGGHPTTALLVIEVSRSSLIVDLEVKANIYAAAGIADYWALDVRGRVLHRHSDPGPDGYRLVSQERGLVRTSGEPVLALDVSKVLPTP